MKIATLKNYFGLVRLSHTIFALPFALLSAAIAIRMGLPEGNQRLPQDLLGIVLCMVSARTAAMAFNRVVDRTFDAANPRTETRHLPTGQVSVGEAVTLVVVSSLLFIAATLIFLPNRLPLLLSLPVLVILLGYSLSKRFTSLSHYWLGCSLGVAPIGAWIALRGAVVERDPFDLAAAILIGLIVIAWVSGFDILYACQDAEFDREHGLRSIPAAIGIKWAMQLARVNHVVMLLFLTVLPLLVPGLGYVYFTGVLLSGGLLVWEHRLVRPDNLLLVNVAFFNANSLIGLILLGVVVTDLWL